ncbi:MAG: hypothetical protein QWI73_07235, partial [Alphaproteobacteria bacterium]|nr:hypothetical protein [Alphaproteobacteria bacterium]
MASAEHRQHSPIEMMRRISASMTPISVHNQAMAAPSPSPSATTKSVDRRTSQPTSVIISNSSSRLSPTTAVAEQQQQHQAQQAQQQQAAAAAAAAVMSSLEAQGIANYSDFVRLMEEQQHQQQQQQQQPLWKRSRHERSISE